ncbi:MAG: hypothetical protein AAF513_10475 [Pseudomonadota bacterium]
MNHTKQRSNNLISLVPLALASLCISSASAHHHHTPEYMQMRQAQFIDRYDADGDSRVSSIEFEQARRNRFDLTDEDADGTVSQAEYVYEWEDRMDAQLAQDRAGQVKQTIVRFGALDKDDDAQMSWDEYNASANRMFARHDTDDDGTIGAADPKPENTWRRNAAQADPKVVRERLLARANRMLRMPSTHTREGLMTRYDSNEDGTITRAEFDSARQADFTRTDEDGNGWVSEDEYVLEYEDRLDTQIAKTRAASVKQAGRRFNALDDDGDEAMTFAEYQDSGHGMFKRWDTSHNGYVAATDALPEPRTEQVANRNTDGQANTSGGG